MSDTKWTEESLADWLLNYVDVPLDGSAVISVEVTKRLLPVIVAAEAFGQCDAYGNCRVCGFGTDANVPQYICAKSCRGYILRTALSNLREG